MSISRRFGFGFLSIAILASPVLGGFASNEVFLASIGRGGGASGAQFYSTLWVTNLSSSATVHFTFFFLKDGQSNLTGDPSFNDTLAPGQTKLYEDVTETKLSLPGLFGAARITADGEIFASERVYNLAHSTDNLGTSEGLFFAAVPKSFAIGLGDTASIQGVNQGSSTENMRTNFDLVETTGNTCKVHVTLLDSNGTSKGATDVNMNPYGHVKLNAQALLSSVNTINGRIVATVTSGSGKVILAGEQLANTSQDSSGFEMSFKDSLLGGGTGVTSLNSLTGALTLTAGSGISVTPSGSSIAIAYTGGGSSGLTAVSHDTTLTGDGTGAHPLGLNPASVVTNVNGIAGPVTLAAGSNATINQSGQTVTIDSIGLNLPFYGESGNTEPFSVRTDGSPSPLALAIQGYSEASSGASVGVFGLAGTNIFNEPSAPMGVYGVGSGFGVSGQSDGGYGVYGRSSSGWGVYGSVGSGAVAATAGVNSSSGPGLYGQSASGSGVYATSGSGFAVYAGGDYGGTGAKYFVEPHPTDPTKEIRYVCLEGGESGTYFRGTGRVVHGFATIEVPDDFRIVTAPSGLTVQLTPVGDLAVLAVMTQGLDRIVVKGSADVTFHYMVNGVRRAFADFQPIAQNKDFIPRSAKDKILTMGLPAESLHRLITSGILNADGSINIETAKKLGWDQRPGWKAEDSPVETKR